MPSVLEPSWVGRRVSVRRVLERAGDGSLRFGDVVGDLLGLDDDTAVVDTRTGLVEVPRPLVALARLAPPSTADELALEAVAARGWRPAETAWLFDRPGGWLLRADPGPTRRAGSVLPLGRPGGAGVDAALDAARAWYAERGLPLQLALPTEARRLLDADLADRGWPDHGDVDVLTRRLDVPTAPGSDAGPATGSVTRLAAPARDPRVALAAAPDDAWLQLWRADRDRPGEAADGTALRALLTRHDPPAAFASVSEDGRTVAIGRGAVDDGWLGITAVTVAAAARRRGLATALAATLAAWGRDHGATRGYVQVAADDAAAQALWTSAGYHRHHSYRYRSEPAGGATDRGAELVPYT
jgi:N-acetylglutamate synthase